MDTNPYIDEGADFSTGLRCVENFHDKFKAPKGLAFHDVTAKCGIKAQITSLAEYMLGRVAWMKGYLEKHPEDVLTVRTVLNVEELAETLMAWVHDDEVEAFDGTVDRIYVALGDAITFNHPLSAGFDEVHRANMAKIGCLSGEAQSGEKGEGWQPPNMAQILKGSQNVD